MRIDRLLCNLRFLRTRALAAALVRGGHLRRNGLRVTRPSQAVAIGDILTVPLGPGVRLIEVLAMPEKRGPAREAQSCYRLLEAGLDQAGETDKGASEPSTLEGDARP